MITAPFVFQPGTTALWSDVIVGALVAMFGGYNAYEANRVTKSGSQPTQSEA